ncbi:MAG: glycosyltransferase family 2 protein [Francisella endosymbiont of Hyalomma asiaticum]
MNNVKISVIMSVYNAEKYIAQAIESILQQSFKDFEFIIVNDGSTDNSLAIIKKYEELIVELGLYLERIGYYLLSKRSYFFSKW